ncbi:MAG: rod shape-determining protein MreD [Chloroflexaceae bacterium]|nr:rod shape-determining protein MreD [Chloroflexaceae bacterium]NJL34365.1 rod shape-determining protein MreD [Chloroflexaceae bacterium]NJO06638.1 rod shape-determining protein MreD [Chloroflexaceae bacterium]
MGDTQSRRLEEHIAREVLIIGAMIGLALVQVTLIPTPLGITSALALVVVVSRVLVGIGAHNPAREVGTAIRWAFYCGIALDLFTTTPAGSHALALLLATILVMLAVGRFQVGGALLPLIAVLLGTLVYEGVLALVYHLTVAQLDWRLHAQVILLPSLLLTLVPTLPIFHLLRWYYRTIRA